MKGPLLCVATLLTFGALAAAINLNHHPLAAPDWKMGDGGKAGRDLDAMAMMAVYDANCAGYALTPVEIKLRVKTFSDLYPREFPAAVAEFKKTIFDKVGRADFCEGTGTWMK